MKHLSFRTRAILSALTLTLIGFLSLATSCADKLQVVQSSMALTFAPGQERIDLLVWAEPNAPVVRFDPGVFVVASEVVDEQGAGLDPNDFNQTNDIDGRTITWATTCPTWGSSPDVPPVGMGGASGAVDTGEEIPPCFVQLSSNEELKFSVIRLETAREQTVEVVAYAQETAERCGSVASLGVAIQEVDN